MNAITGFGSSAGSVQQIMAMRQQLIERSQLLQQLHSPQQTNVVQNAEGPTPSFANALQSALEGVSATQNKAETLSAAYERGEETDVAKVMLARQESGVAFEATLQVRNRLLTAYQDIMRMGV